jgi:putative acyl-CoA dehydrogenase
MPVRDPLSQLATHEVTNQPPPLEDTNLFDGDAPLREALRREGADWATDEVRAFGGLLGGAPVIELGFLANRHPPELRGFDRFGHRIDEVEYHPAYHELMTLAVEHRVPSIAWAENRAGGHVAHTALEYMLIQAEAGVCCPITMTYAVLPALRNQPEIAAEWEPRVLAAKYDPRSIPASEKTGATLGMAMTEKQGGSDVRANTTRAEPLGKGGPGAEYALTGHKWFCSAPMSDAFLALAYTDNGLSCFLVPRWRPDGTRNAIRIQRLKDKLGNRSNASGEIEYEGAWARMVGEEGRGVRTIIDMVHHTRLDCVLAAAGLMRQALAQALHHTSHRTAFQKLLSQQPLMRNVLADLAIECEAATALAMRVARGFDEGATDESARGFARVAVAVGKYWINKRAQAHIYEAMECLGGAGYVEESILPRLYREAPVNSIWEGSGNVMCLDVLRAMQKEPDSIAAFVAEVESARGADKRLDMALDGLQKTLADGTDMEMQARRTVEMMALTLQGALLVQHAPAAVADAFCTTRLAGNWGQAFGTMPSGLALDDIIARANPSEG